MKDQSEFRVVALAMKRALKAKKISYRELASELGLTESGVKKILNGRDGSFVRLTQICHVIGISLADLLQEKDGNDLEDVSFTSEQQDFFLKNMDHFEFFWKLAFERLPLEEIQSDYALTREQCFRYLRKLDEIGILEIHPGDRVKVPRLRRVRTFGDGPLIRKLYQDWSRKFMTDIAKPDPGPDRQFIIRYFKLRKDSYREFLSAIAEIEKEFLRRAIHEMQFYPKDTFHVRWISGADSGTFIDKITRPR